MTDIEEKLKAPTSAFQSRWDGVEIERQSQSAAPSR